MARRGDVGKELLKEVSRSFYLSLRILPEPMREPLSLGYLLARASDTLADTGAVPVARRAEFLRAFADRVAGKHPLDDFAERLRREFAPHQSDPGEKRLVERIAEPIERLDREPRETAAAIREVLATIVSGQLWDLTFFAENDDRRPVTREDLERYTFQVAGCVGKFWTRIGFLALGEKFSTAAESELDRLGVNYGCGLQLVNILRDVEKDRQLGRCYLPVENPADAAQLQEARRRWTAEARSRLADGIAYASQLRSRRVRAATVLPSFLGVETLDALDRATPEELRRGVKIPRSTVYRALARAVVFPGPGGG